MVTRRRSPGLRWVPIFPLLCALGAGPAALAQSGRYAVGEKGFRTIEEFAKAAPEDVVTRVREIERGLGPLGPHARFALHPDPADLLVVSTLEPSRTKTLGKRLAAAHAVLRRKLVEPPAWKRPLRFTVKPPAAPVSRPDWEREIVLESVPGSGGLSRLGPGMAFDVAITEGLVTNRDESAERPGTQVGAGANGLLTVRVDKGRLDTARTGIFTAVSVKDPQIGGWAEAHFSLSDPPVRNFPIVILVSEEAGEYEAALRCLETAFPSTPDRAAQVRAARTMSGFTSDYPPVVVFRDFMRRLPGDEKWVTENRLVHALAHVVPPIYYGPLPFTIGEAIAWDVEMTMVKAVEAFCPYGGVTPDADPTGWEKLVADGLAKSPGAFDLGAALSLHAGGLAPESRDEDAARREMTLRCAATWAAIRYALDDPARNAKFRAFLHRLRGDSEWEGPPPASEIAARFRSEVGDPFK